MHFFCELTNLPTESESFGPIPVGSNPDYDKQFNIGSKFSLSQEIKAFACQDGMMIVRQSSNSDLVNVIIKPTKAQDINFTSVKYYVYRGLLKCSFIDTSGDITPVASTNTEFIDRFWQNWDDYKSDTNQPSLPDPTPQALGYDTTLPGTLNIGSIYNNSQTDVRAVQVKEGEWIGDFGTLEPVVFEVIVDTDHLKVDLDYLSQLQNIVDVTGLPDSTSEEQFSLKVKKEEILYYVDPSAFFGMHYRSGINVSSYNGTTKDTEKKKRDNLVDDVLVKFLNKTRVYIDVRSEYGYSYNFYQNYGDSNGNLIRVKASNETNFNDDPYYTFGWPIFYDENTIGTNFRNKIDIQLRIDDNVAPLLFIDGESRKIISKFSDNLINPNNPDWTRTQRLVFPNTGSGNNKDNVAYHIKLQYLRKEDSTSSPNTVLKRNDVLDQLFPNIDLPSLDGTIDVFEHLKSTKHSFVLDSDFGYVFRSGIYKDSNNIVFYTEPEFKYKESFGSYSIPSVLKKTKSTPLINSPVFPKNIKLNRINVKEGIDDVFIISISSVNKFGKTSKKESLFLLGITTNELNILSNEADNIAITSDHQRSIIFTNEIKFEVLGEIPFTKYELNIQGLSVDGTYVSTTSTGIFVYTLDGRCFNSKDFGDQSNIPLGLPDSGTLSPWKHVGKWEYDRNDLNVKNIHPSGFATVDDGVDRIVELKGVTYYPSDNIFGGLSNVKSEYPAIFIVHGNGHNYLQYKELCKHLARNGFFATSINLLFDEFTDISLNTVPDPVIYSPFTHFFTLESKVYLFDNVSKEIHIQLDSPPNFSTKKIKRWVINNDFFVTTSLDKIMIIETRTTKGWGMRGLGRSNLLYEHLKILRDKFSEIENKIGIMGHSRGAEAVIHSANEILSPSTPGSVREELENINMENLLAVISLAPTDFLFSTKEILDKQVNFFVLYGSRDYDVSGAFAPSSASSKMGTGFSLYDRAKNQEKSMLFVYGATHNGFITSNKVDIDIANDFGVTVGEDELINKSIQHNISFSYMNAMFRRSIFNEDFWKPLFSGDIIPESVEESRLYAQYETHDTNNIIIDFPSSSIVSVGSSQSYNGLSLNWIDGDLRSNDLIIIGSAKTNGTSPHDTSGISLNWEGGKIFSFDFSVQDVSTFDYLSFRISNALKSKELTGVKVVVRSASVTKNINLKTISPVDNRTDKIIKGINYDPTKTAMQSIRIPLVDYVNQGIDLTSVDKIEFIFPDLYDGKVTIDNIMFTK